MFNHQTSHFKNLKKKYSCLYPIHQPYSLCWRDIEFIFILCLIIFIFYWWKCCCHWVFFGFFLCNLKNTLFWKYYNKQVLYTHFVHEISFVYFKTDSQPIHNWKTMVTPRHTCTRASILKYTIKFNFMIFWEVRKSHYENEISRIIAAEVDKTSIIITEY